MPRRFVDKNDSKASGCDPGYQQNFYQPQHARTYFTQDWVPTAIGAYPDPNGGVLCPNSQPPWSAYRQPAFGYGILTLLDATTATWQAYNTDIGASGAAVDEVAITRNSGSASCLAKHAAVAL